MAVALVDKRAQAPGYPVVAMVAVVALATLLGATAVTETIPVTVVMVPLIRSAEVEAADAPQMEPVLMETLPVIMDLAAAAVVVSMAPQRTRAVTAAQALPVSS